MWYPPAAVLIQLAIRPFLKWFWEEGKDVLDYGYRRQPDANDGQFGEFDAVMPRFMN